MWRQLPLRKVCLRPLRSIVGGHATLRPATCRLFTTACQHMSRPTLILFRSCGLRETQLSFISLVQPCCVRAFSSSADEGSGEAQNKMEPPKKPKRALTEEEFAVLREMFNKKFRAQKLQKIKEKQSKSFYYYTENNYIGIAEAKEDFLLTDKDLSGLRTFRRSSPYDHDSKLTGVHFIDVALLKEVKKIAIRKWGSIEAIEVEKRRNAYYNASSKFGSFNLQSKRSTFKEAFSRESGLVVMMALVMNVVNLVCKIVILMMTGSNAVFSEIIHSGADILNQVFLAAARYMSLKRPDIHHPYGYVNFQPIMSIFCGVVFFSMGFGVSAYRAALGIMDPVAITDTSILMVIQLLAVTFCTEAVSLSVAVRQVRKDAKKQGLPVLQYVMKAEDPLVNVVLLEDMAGVLGVLVCGGAISSSIYFNQPIIDALGSLTIGMMMAGVSWVLFKTSTDILLGKSLWYEEKVKQVIQNDRMVNAVFDNKTIDMGDQSRLKTEVLLDVHQLTRHLLDKYDEDAMLMQFQSIKTVEDMENFLETYGKELYDEIVSQIDRIENEVKNKFPEIRHIDIEPT